jgi:holo-[acyl-carrier protein] synthase
MYYNGRELNEEAQAQSFKEIMMIKGIGVDILAIGRIGKMIDGDDRFIRKVFTREEIEYCTSKAKIAQHYAARFTAKEAFFKALGSGWRYGMSWKDVWVENNRLGKPEIRISGKARHHFDEMKFKKIHLSVSHTEEYAVAFVLIE